VYKNINNIRRVVHHNKVNFINNNIYVKCEVIITYIHETSTDILLCVYIRGVSSSESRSPFNVYKHKIIVRSNYERAVNESGGLVIA